MKKFLSVVFMVVVTLLSTTGCGKQQLTRDTFVKGATDGPWGYIFGTRKLVRDRTQFNLMMNIQIAPITKGGESPFVIGATSAVKGYYFYRVRPGRYFVREWNTTGEDGVSRSHSVNYAFEVRENTITYLGFVRFYQQGFVQDGREWIRFRIHSTDAMNEDIKMLHNDIPETKDLKVINEAWKYPSGR